MKEETVKEILKSTPKLYDEIASDFYQTRKKPWPITDLIKSYAIKADDIVDLGCGSGRLSELIAKDQNYLGLDNSSNLIKIAQNNYSNRKNINFQVQDIINLKLPENKFDLALIVAVLHHIPTKKLRSEILQNVRKSLTSDGLIIITAWNLWQKDYRRYLLNYKLKLAKYKLLSLNDAFIPWKISGRSEMRYVHSFSKSELKNLLETSGFKVKEIFYEDQGQRTSHWQGKNIIAIAEKK
ncbi:MAG: methyltransferase domain-containing protein [Candidatus Buchananbacteria bacterium]|nr:methyltransferase domain-containing protein [Candidatus Buchananbacteria bacterium]